MPKPKAKATTMEKLLSRQGVADHCGLSLETIKRYRADGDMPDPDVMYERTPLWYPSTIDAWRKSFRPYEKGGKA